MVQMNNRQFFQPPRPFVVRQRAVPPLPQLPPHVCQLASVPPRPVIVKRLPPLPQNPIHIHIVQRIQHLGIRQVDPQVYLARYGSSLLDSSTLVEQARSIGIIDDIVSDLLT